MIDFIPQKQKKLFMNIKKRSNCKIHAEGIKLYYVKFTIITVFTCYVGCYSLQHDAVMMKYIWWNIFFQTALSVYLLYVVKYVH